MNGAYDTLELAILVANAAGDTTRLERLQAQYRAALGRSFARERHGDIRDTFWGDDLRSVF